jgi:hypothetical protein
MAINMPRTSPALIVSFVVDRDPVFAYTGWNLAQSLAHRGQFRWPDIHVQCTPEVDRRTVEMFDALGCTTHQLQPFGDGKYCNKLAQWENLKSVHADHIVFLDTDMICVSEFAEFLDADSIGGKIVDLANPELPIIDALFQHFGFDDRPQLAQVDGSDEFTYRTNCNGGFYSVPSRFAEPLFDAWRGYAELLLSDLELLRKAGKEAHVDQIAFCMAMHRTGLPFTQLSSNVNYYLHFHGPHASRVSGRPLAILHYHNSSLNVVGMLEPPGPLEEDEQAAVDVANKLVESHFNTHLFWEMRYNRFPERGSGVGSRGANLEYKRALLKAEGAEQAASVLDVGCGDLEVVGPLDLHNYVGLDRSDVTLAAASAARPDWTFVRAPAPHVTPAELVLCFEVAIHQQSAEDYFELIRFVAEKTSGTLIISGYDESSEEIRANHMLFFYEPLRTSLERTGKFSSIRPIGKHTTVVVYRCDVG